MGEGRVYAHVCVRACMRLVCTNVQVGGTCQIITDLNASPMCGFNVVADKCTLQYIINIGIAYQDQGILKTLLKIMLKDYNFDLLLV